MKTSNTIQLLYLLCSCVFATGCASVDSTPSLGSSSEQDSTASIHTELAINYLRPGLLEIARDELQTALDIQGNHSDANYVPTLLMLRLNEIDRADGYFLRAIKSNSENASAAHDYGVYLCQRGQYQESIRYFSLAANNPLFENKHLSLSRAGECIAGESIEEGEAFLKRALDINPTISSALAKMAEIRFLQQNYMGARAYVERYISVVDPDARTLMLGYEIERALNDEVVASQYREQLLQAYPESSEATRLRVLPR